MKNLQKVLKKKLSLETSTSRTILELVDGRREELVFNQVRPTEFTVSDSNFNLKSGVNVEIEIENVDLVAASKTLWPNAEIRVRGGLNGQGAPIKAHATIPANKVIVDGVDAESFLYWVIETPEGNFHNKQPIHMKGHITGLPPKDATFNSQDVVPIFDANDQQVGTLYSCLQSN
ncbi:hypothetical protein LCY76_23050 [Fictibacillus sp. KIGAM418]|uniref:Uncharacterized protein n=1 Tax=Fictibacillus marinisediminis TaxID=2878389 RepID=A0A9X2BJA6_9BACL|nr:hypothetical protein [Fictibacillus marinisediminis]MCK6259453.1 hypothetical protein [Fictibacillus marinisediminis]